MAEFPYSLAIGRMQQFLKEIPTTGTPEKVTVKVLEERGYKSTNDRPIVPTLKFLGLIDASGAPTAKWKALRDREQYGRVMAHIVRESYHDLFALYPDAQEKSEKDIHNFIGKNTDAAMRMVSAMVSVFKMLCSLSDFEAEPISDEDVADHPAETGEPKRGTEKLSGNRSAASSEAGISIQLHLTVGDATPDQIEATFKHAAKYLLAREVD